MISPLIDDLPTFIFVSLTLTIFLFTFTQVLNIYKSKILYYKFNKYYILSTSYLLSNGIISDKILLNYKNEINQFLSGTKFNFDACILKKRICCYNVRSQNIIIGEYLIPYFNTNNGEIIPARVRTCMWYS